MTERMAGSDHINEHEPDARLSLLLKEWKGVEPQVDFETAVWERIRSVPGTEAAPAGILLALRDWLAPSSAWINAVAAAAGIVIGIRLAFAAPMGQRHLTMNVALPYSATLANAYLSTVLGGQP